MLAIIMKHLAAQKRVGADIPDWHHARSVSEIIESVLKESKEVAASDELFEEIVSAALGHDLYEDSAVTREYIKSTCGSRTDALIWWLTNEEDDHYRSNYLKKIYNAHEEAKLIKLADLIDNTIGAAYNIDRLSAKWVRVFYLPIVTEMKEQVSTDRFAKYPKTGLLLNERLGFCLERLDSNLKKFETMQE